MSNGRPFTPSKVGAFETCPRKYAATYVSKTVPYTDSDHTIFGKAVHKQLEDYLNNRRTTLHPMLAKLEPVLDALKPYMLGAETRLAITPRGKSTSYFDKGAWHRCIIDMVLVTEDRKTVFVLDWKTGKPKDDYIQSDMTAHAALAQYGKATKVITAFLYLFRGGADVRVYERNQPLPARTAILLEEIEAAHEFDDFPPKPSGLCGKWCEVFTCEYNGRKTK